MDAQGRSSDRPPGRSGARRVSPRVYRRRRLLAAILALLVLAGVIWAVIAVLGGQDSGAQSADGTAADTAPSGAPAETTETQVATPPPSAEASEPVCDPAQIVVSAATDAPAYASGQNPVLTLTVTNNGDVACPVNVGTSQMEFLVTSGEDRIFSSVDCQEGPEDLDREILPGGSEEANFTWERNRSVPGCEAVEASPTPGFYNLTVSLGDRTSDEASFELQ